MSGLTGCPKQRLTWSELMRLDKNWTELLQWMPKPKDPEAGYSWLDVAAATFVWESMRELGLDWAALMAQLPGGHWEDLITVEVTEGGEILLQLNAADILTKPTPKLKITYDPATLDWSGKFLWDGMPVGDAGTLPEEVECSGGELRFTYPKQAEDFWSGLVSATSFTAKQDATAEIRLS